MLKAGVIGMGVGEKHALAYEDHDQVTLKKVCDFDQERLNELRNKFSFLSMEIDDQSILKDENIDIVSIASYDNYHANQIIQAFENGKNVFVEKPLCLNQSEMIKIMAAKKQNNNVKISSNLVLRSNSRFSKFKNDIQKRKFGDIYYLEGDYYWGRRNKLFGWRAEMDYYSIILGAAIHMIDLVMWLLDSRPISVQAMGNDISTRDTNLQFDSFAVVLLKFENGTIVKLTGNGGCVHPHFHGLKIFGTERTAVHNLTGAYYLDSGEPSSEPIPITEPYPEKEVRTKVIHSFVNSILDSSITPLVSEQDVFDVMSVCFAASKAMDIRESKNIEYLNL